MRKKGTPKTGGRKKGTPNKVTTDVKTWLAGLIDNNRKQVEDDLSQLEPKERIMIFERLLQYVVPKQQAVSAQIDLNTLSDEQLNTIINELTKDLK